MIDFHTHILPAIDDGAISVDDSIAMARALEAFGYRAVCCTPHCIKGYYDLTPQKVREATLMLQADLDNADIALDLWPGMEYMLDEHFAGYADDLLPIGETRLILCEAPQDANEELVFDGLTQILDRGFVPFVAHPERSRFFYQELTKREESGQREERSKQREKTQSQSFLKRLFAPFTSHRAPLGANDKNRSISTGFPEGVIYHANLGSFTGFYGEEVQRRAYDLLKLGVFSAVTSDLHDSGSAAKVLQKDKIEMNPILKNLARFDGNATPRKTGGGDKKGQGELF